MYIDYGVYVHMHVFTWMSLTPCTTLENLLAVEVHLVLASLPLP